MQYDNRYLLPQGRAAEGEGVGRRQPPPWGADRMISGRMNEEIYIGEHLVSV